MWVLRIRGIANQEFEKFAERKVVIDFPKIEIDRTKEIPDGTLRPMDWKPLKEIITFTGD